MADGVSIKTGSGFQSGFEGIAKGLIPNPLDDIRAAALGSTVAKNNEDIAKLRQLQIDNARWREYTAGGNITPQGLLTAAGPNPDLLRLVPEINLFNQAYVPGATPQTDTRAYVAAGKPYGSTPLGWQQGEQYQTQRTLGAAHIGAGPGYARVAEDKRQFNQTPTYLIDPATNQVLPPMPRERVNSLGQPMMPASPELYLGLLKPQDYGSPQGNMQMGLGDYTRAFQGRPAPAPAPSGVLQQREEPIVVSPAPGAPGQYSTKGAVAGSAPPLQQGQPVYQPPPQAQPVAPPTPTPINRDAALDIDQLARITMARSGSLTDDYFDKNPGSLPQDFVAKREAINRRAGELYAAGGDMAEAVRVAMDENLGVGWKLNGGGWFSSPYLSLGATGNYTGPQVQRDPSGVRVVPPTPSRTPVQPAKPTGPTVSVTGNPKPTQTQTTQAQPIARAPEGTQDGTRMQTPDGRPGVVRGGLLFAE